MLEFAYFNSHPSYHMHTHPRPHVQFCVVGACPTCIFVHHDQYNMCLCDGFFFITSFVLSSVLKMFSEFSEFFYQKQENNLDWPYTKSLY